jgi:hypothetical protein
VLLVAALILLMADAKNWGERMTLTSALAELPLLVPTRITFLKESCGEIETIDQECRAAHCSPQA